MRSCKSVPNSYDRHIHPADLNRHHYSLYVHNCRLILLLRQDPSEAENYKPAEFHWKLDQVGSYGHINSSCFYFYFLFKMVSTVSYAPCSLQVCDKEWHHYVLNVEFPTVTLFVDGTTFEPFLVTEDYPLHASRIETQLTVGACWQGRTCKTLSHNINVGILAMQTLR